MVYKLFNLNTSGFMNSSVLQNPKPVEALNFIAQNILVFEESVFRTVYSIMQKIDVILDSTEGAWLKNFYVSKVAVPNGTTQIDFHIRNAIIVQCICEILSIYRYVYIERGEEPLEIPTLPESKDLEEENIPRIYLKDVDAKYEMFLRTRT